MGANLRDAVRLSVLGAVSLGVFLIVLLPAAGTSAWMNFHVEDAPLYRAYADLVAEHGLLHDSPSQNEYIRARMPGYPFLLIGLQWIVERLGVSLGAAATGANIFFMIAGVLLFHRALVVWLGDQRIAFFGAAAVLVTPGVAPYVFAHMPESLTFFLWSAAAVCLASRNRSLAPWCAGVLAGIATLTKPLSLLIAAAVVPMLFLVSSERRPRRAVLFALGLAPLPALWLLRNWMVWGAVLMTPNAGTHLYDYLSAMLKQHQGLATTERHPLTQGIFDPRLPTTTEAWKEKFGFDYDNLGKRSDLLRQLAMEDILADPLGYAKLSASRQGRLYVGAGTQALFTMSFADPQVAREAVRQPGWLWKSGWWIYQAAAGIILFAGYVLAAIGVWKGLRDPRLRPAVIVCLVLLLLQAMVVGPFGHTRYRFLMTPFFGVLAAVGFVMLRSRQDQVVAVHDLLPPRTWKEVRKLRGRATHDPTDFVGGVVR